MYELDRVSPLEHKKKPKISVSLVLDNLRSANNVGAIFRTADAFSVKKIYLIGICPHPPHKEIRKTALGATESVDWEYFSDIDEWHKVIDENKSKLLAIEQAHGSTYLSNVEVDKNTHYFLIFGNEVEGVSEELLKLCDEYIEIPQSGSKHSLNVATSAGIVIWDFYNQQMSK